MGNSSSENLDVLLRALPDCFLRLDEGGNVIEHVSGGQDDKLLNPKSLPGRHVADVLPAAAAADVLRNIRRALKTRELAAIEFCLGEDDAQQLYELRLIVTGRRHLLAVIRNMTRVAGKNSAGRSADGSVTYENWLRHVDGAISEARLRERGLVMMIVAFERADELRSRLGRAVHDAVLTAARARIESCVRGRANGEGSRAAPATEVVLLPSTGECMVLLRDAEERETARQVAKRIRDAFQSPVAYEEHSFSISPRCGIATFPMDGGNAEEILQNGRAALDEARMHSAESHQFFSDTTRYRVRRRLDVSNELRWAIEKDQLELRYLPRLDLGSGRIAGLEALLRWQHPLRGTIGLGEVLPLAQSTGLMGAIGEWVLESACRQAAEWRDEWKSLPPVGINLSAEEFHRDDLVEVITETLGRHGLDAAALELEIGESLLTREDKAGLQLGRLNALGVGVVIDDFGRGYSSLLRMADLPIRAIKIDRSIVDECQREAKRGSVCAAIIAMAGHLGLTVIAEGVETIEQINFLREHGCDGLQGFFFTEPLPAGEIPAFLMAHLGETPDGKVVDMATIRTRFSLRSAS